MGYTVDMQVKWSKIANHPAVSYSICDRRGADTNLAFQSLTAVHIPLSYL